jgi:hypothetical protein
MPRPYHCRDVTREQLFDPDLEAVQILVDFFFHLLQLYL